MLRYAIAIPLALGFFALPAAAQNVDPAGAWVDRYGTSFEFSLCGDGTDLCGVLKDIQGKSRTPDNLAYVNQQVVSAEQVGNGEWKGTVIYDGAQAAATVKQVSPDTIKITGCRAIFCQTLTFNRV
ncbi:MAG: hypothetical protein EOP20_10595 [Hyphomicrobiales bacterium]|nr:MAG: hypothetical protein EOP20_10595 [Hyphomicrobiales bacterium]